MQKISITSLKYTGEVQLLYSAAGVLEKIDFFNSTCSMEQRAKLKDTIPVQQSMLTAFCEPLNLTILESQYEVSFDAFWEAFKNKSNQPRALREWAKIDSAKRLKAINRIKAYEGYLKRNSTWAKKMQADTWIRDERYNDEWENK